MGSPITRQLSGVEWIGHRGAPRVALENTIAAFQAAVAQGADGIELDVHVTADGVPVVHHDAVLSQSTDPPGLRGRAIAELTESEVSQGVVGRGALSGPVPTLAAAIEAIAPEAVAYIEVKGGSPEAVVAALSRCRAVYAFHSFDHDLVAQLARIAPAIPRGILIDRRDIDVEAAMKRTGARDVWPGRRVIDRTLVTTVHRAGGRVIVWTVNDASEAAELIALGVDGVCSDDLPAVRGASFPPTTR
jgi:glycerophosphoryl diester phosphodiesterase